MKYLFVAGALALAACAPQPSNGISDADATAVGMEVLNTNPGLLRSPAILSIIEKQSLADGDSPEQVAFGICTLANLTDDEIRKLVALGGGNGPMSEAGLVEVIIPAMSRPEVVECLPNKLAELRARS